MILNIENVLMQIDNMIRKWNLWNVHTHENATNIFFSSLWSSDFYYNQYRPNRHFWFHNYNSWLGKKCFQFFIELCYHVLSYLRYLLLYIRLNILKSFIIHFLENNLLSSMIFIKCCLIHFMSLEYSLLQRLSSKVTVVAKVVA